MKNLSILLVTVLVSVVAQAGTFYSVPTSLSHLVKACQKTEHGLFDYYACPKVERFQYKKDSDLGNLGAFLEKKGLDVKATTAKEGVTVLRDSIENPISFVSEIIPGFEEDDLKLFRKSFSAYKDANQKFLEAVENAAANADNVLVDEDTYWAPSVNARALVLVNKAKKGVTILWHGDTDG